MCSSAVKPASSFVARLYSPQDDSPAQLCGCSVSPHTLWLEHSLSLFPMHAKPEAGIALQRWHCSVILTTIAVSSSFGVPRHSVGSVVLPPPPYGMLHLHGIIAVGIAVSGSTISLQVWCTHDRGPDCIRQCLRLSLRPSHCRHCCMRLTTASVNSLFFRLTVACCLMHSFMMRSSLCLKASSSRPNSFSMSCQYRSQHKHWHCRGPICLDNSCETCNTKGGLLGKMGFCDIDSGKT